MVYKLILPAFESQFQHSSQCGAKRKRGLRKPLFLLPSVGVRTWYTLFMKKKILFSSLAIFLLAIGFFVWKERVIISNQYQINEVLKKTSLIETPTERPEIGYDEWKENHSDRTQLAGYYSKDSEGAYWYHMTIIGANQSTFDTYSDRYARDKSNVYYAGNSDLYTIMGADVSTFQTLGDGYARDKDHAYFRGGRIRWC